ncbi:MAG: hypothetical protein AB2814_06690 [Candidatus Sedimenticola endophacoides]
MKDFGTSQSPKSTRQRDNRYCPDRPALITTPSRTLQPLTAFASLSMAVSGRSRSTPCPAVG